MKLLLRRKYKAENYTIGDLSIDGRFFYHTIEDKVRELPAPVPRYAVGTLVPLQGESVCPHGDSGRHLQGDDGIQCAVQAGAAVPA